MRISLPHSFAAKTSILIIFSLLLLAILTLVPRVDLRKRPEALTVAVAQHPAFALIFVADKKGYFKDADLEVTFHAHILGRDALQEVVEGKADLATVFDIPYVRKVYEGENLGALTTLHQSTQTHALAAFKKNGIAKPQDLRFKKIAITQGTSTEYFLYNYLLEQGIDQHEVTIVSLEPEELVPALQKGSVSAAVLFNPYLNQFRKLNSLNDITLFQSSTYTEMSLLTGKTGYIEKNSPKIVKFLTALDRAEQYIGQNPTDAIKLTAASLPKIDTAVIQDTWSLYTYNLTLSNLFLVNLDREAAFFRDTNVYNNPLPDMRSTLVADYLRSVRPEKVTLY